MPAKSSATNPCGGTWKRWKNSVVPVNACRENPDRSFTAVLSSGCDVCDPNGDLCINFVVETTFTTADRYIYSMERLCYQFIQGNESGYFCSETIRHAYRGIDEHTFSYNHEPCEMLEGEFWYNKGFDCNGVHIDLMAEGIFRDATDLFQSYRWDETRSVPGSCEAANTASSNDPLVDVKRMAIHYCEPDYSSGLVEGHKEYSTMLQVFFECKGNADLSATQVIKTDCDICRSDGSVCARFHRERTFRDDHDEARSGGRCYNYTKGHNGDSLCGSWGFSWGFDDSEGSILYNDEPCNKVAEFDDGSWFDCNGVRVSTSIDNPVEGDPLFDAFDIELRYWSLLGAGRYDFENLQEADIVLGSCTPILDNQVWNNSGTGGQTHDDSETNDQNITSGTTERNDDAIETINDNSKPSAARSLAEASCESAAAIVALLAILV